MSDIHCPVCGEPWDAYGVNHGDMLAWEAKLFKAGAGCPSCEGEAPEGTDVEACELEHAKNVVLDVADDDPHAYEIANRLGVLALSKDRPAWKRPEDMICWSCESCRASVMLDADDNKTLYWISKKYKCDTLLERRWDEALIATAKNADHSAPLNLTINKTAYCPGCVEECGECGSLEFADNLILPQGHYGKDEAVCEDCYAKIPTCYECGEQFEENELNEERLCQFCDREKLRAEADASRIDYE